MSGKGIVLGTFSADGTLSADISPYSGTLFSLYVSGSLGGGTISFKGGVSTHTEAIKITSYSNAGTHTALTTASPGLYTFNACCLWLDFVMAGSAAPSCTLTLFPERRL